MKSSEDGEPWSGHHSRFAKIVETALKGPGETCRQLVAGKRVSFVIPLVERRYQLPPRDVRIFEKKREAVRPWLDAPVAPNINKNTVEILKRENCGFNDAVNA
jgi:hypothetical protein